MTPKQYQKALEEIEQIEKESSRAEGKLEQVMDLLSEYGVKSLKEAKALLSQKKGELEEKEVQVDKAAKAFHEKWEGRL